MRGYSLCDNIYQIANVLYIRWLGSATNIPTIFIITCETQVETSSHAQVDFIKYLIMFQ